MTNTNTIAAAQLAVLAAGIPGNPAWAPNFTIGYADACTDIGACLQTKNDLRSGSVIVIGAMPEIAMYAVISARGERFLLSEDQLKAMFHRPVFKVDVKKAMEEILGQRETELALKRIQTLGLERRAEGAGMFL